MNPTQVIEYLESHPLDEGFVKILQKGYEFDSYHANVDSFLFYHYGQLPNPSTDFKIWYASPVENSLFGSSSRAGPHWAPNLPQEIRRTTTGRLDTSKVFSRRTSGYGSTIEPYQDPDGERGLRFRYYWINLIGENYDDEDGRVTENPLEDYYLDPAVREEYADNIDEWYGYFEYAEFDLPYKLPCVSLNYPTEGILG